MRDTAALREVMSATFGINASSISYECIERLVEQIDDLVLAGYFSAVWQPHNTQYTYTGDAIIDEVNKLEPLNVIDIGCGYNHLKGKITGLVGIDAYNDAADIKSMTLDYTPNVVYDVALCLGSVNFGSVDKIFNEVRHVVSMVKPGGYIFFRCNPGEQHTAPESKWIEFFEWTPEFIANMAIALECRLDTLRMDTGNRYYAVLQVGG